MFSNLFTLKNSHQIRREQPVLPCLQVRGFCRKDFYAGVKMQQTHTGSILVAKDVSWVSWRHFEPIVCGYRCNEVEIALFEHFSYYACWKWGWAITTSMRRWMWSHNYLADSRPKVGAKKVWVYLLYPWFSKTCSAGVWDGIAPERMFQYQSPPQHMFGKPRDMVENKINEGYPDSAFVWRISVSLKIFNLVRLITKLYQGHQGWLKSTTIPGYFDDVRLLPLEVGRWC